MPSCALRTATFRPLTCERSFSEMTRPAASSAARLIRKPEESFSSDFDIAVSLTVRLRYELIAAMLVLILRPILVGSSLNLGILTDFPVGPNPFGGGWRVLRKRARNPRNPRLLCPSTVAG